MNELFVRSIYESIVEENLGIYKNIYKKGQITERTDEYWKQAIGLYKDLSDDNKEILMRIIKQTMIDTISNVFGIIDGSSTLKNCTIQPKLFLDSVDTEGELQDYFLTFIEENEA